MEVVSVCVKCRHQNTHEVDHDGQAAVTCESCSTVYNVKTYEVRATGGRRDRRSGIKHYRIRVKEPDRDETLLEFDSKQDIEARSGDWVTGSFSKGKLKYLLNHKIRQYWDVQQGMGCAILGLMLAALLVAVISVVVFGLLSLF